MNNEKIAKVESFEKDFNFLYSLLQNSQRLSFNHNSQDYGRVRIKLCYYAVRYHNQHNLFNFGIIKFFVKINERVVVYINKLEIVGNIW